MAEPAASNWTASSPEREMESTRARWSPNGRDSVSPARSCTARADHRPRPRCRRSSGRRERSVPRRRRPARNVSCVKRGGSVSHQLLPANTPRAAATTSAPPTAAIRRRRPAGEALVGRGVREPREGLEGEGEIPRRLKALVPGSSPGSGAAPARGREPPPRPLPRSREDPRSGSRSASPARSEP